MRSILLYSKNKEYYFSYILILKMLMPQLESFSAILRYRYDFDLPEIPRTIAHLTAGMPDFQLEKKSLLLVRQLLAMFW